MKTAVAVGTFRAACHKTRHAAGHPKSCTCGTLVTCDLATDDPELFADHMKDAHSVKSWKQNFDHRRLPPQWVSNAGKPWKAGRSRTLFEPEPFGVGATVTWYERPANPAGLVQPGPPTVRTGQVWSGHPYPKTMWVVAEGKAYPVSERQLMREEATA